MIINSMISSSSGGSASIEALNVTQNGTYTASGGVDGYSPVTVNVSGGSDGSFKAVIERTATTPTLPSNLTKVGTYAFYRCSDLEITALPIGVTTIENYAFYDCSKLALSSLPSNLTSIGGYAFYNCKNITLQNLPASVTTIGNNAFYNCEKITLTALPSGLTSIGGTTFQGCYGITLTSLPDTVTSIGGTAFNSCTGITSISCNGAITSLGSASFTGSSGHSMAITSVSFPNMAVSSLGNAFGNTAAYAACQQLVSADVGKTSTIAGNAFANCYKLQTLVLRKTGSICTLGNVSAFTNTPMRGYNSLTGTVYVPSALIATYKTATNWKTLYDGGTLTFAAIEGSQYAL